MGACLVAESNAAMIDQNWESRFVLAPEATGPDAQVAGMTFDPVGNLYIVGSFVTVGKNSAQGVARYDGTNWFSLGGGIPELNVHTVAAVGSNVYVGGFFVRPASGITNLARWDGNNWSALGNGLGDAGGRSSNEKFAAGITNLFVSGNFDNASGIPVTNLARWDGTQWHSMDYSPSPFTNFSTIAAMTSKGEELFICERTMEFGGLGSDILRVKKWDAGNWSDLGDVLMLDVKWPPTSTFLRSMISIGTNLFVSGKFSIDALSAVNLIRWDGTTWSAVAHPFDSSSMIGPMTSDGTNLFTVVQSPEAALPEATLAKWGGLTWKILGTGVAKSSSPFVYGLAMRGRDLFVGGDFNFAGGKPADYLALWHDFPEVTLSGRGWQTNGQFGLRIHGGKGQLVQVQSSTNLQDWLDLGTQLPDSNQYDFEITASTTTSNQLYRLRLIP